MTLNLGRAALTIRLITKNRYTQLDFEWSVVHFKYSSTWYSEYFDILVHTYYHATTQAVVSQVVQYIWTGDMRKTCY